MTCTHCGKVILPGEEAFHRQGKPVLHRKHFAGPELEMDKEPARTIRAVKVSRFSKNNEVLTLPKAHPATKPGPLRWHRYFAVRRSEVFWFASQRERAMWVVGNEAARRVSREEAMEIIERGLK